MVWPETEEAAEQHASTAPGSRWSPRPLSVVMAWLAILAALTLDILAAPAVDAQQSAVHRIGFLWESPATLAPSSVYTGRPSERLPRFRSCSRSTLTLSAAATSQAWLTREVT
jgi:hypothetical protein